MYIQNDLSSHFLSQGSMDVLQPPLHPKVWKDVLPGSSCHHLSHVVHPLLIFPGQDFWQSILGSRGPWPMQNPPTPRPDMGTRPNIQWYLDQDPVHGPWWYHCESRPDHKVHQQFSGLSTFDRMETFPPELDDGYQSRKKFAISNCETKMAHVWTIPFWVSRRSR